MNIAFRFHAYRVLFSQEKPWVEAIWGAALGVLLSVVHGALHCIRVRIHLDQNPVLFLAGNRLHSNAIGTFRRIQWNLLEGIVAKHPQLRTIDIQVVYDGPRLAPSDTTLIEEGVSSKLMKVVRFSY